MSEPDDLTEVREEHRLDSLPIMEAVEDDPAPDLSFGPTHPHVSFLADRYLERDANEPALPPDPKEAFLLGYATAMYDLKVHTSESTFSVKVVGIDTTAHFQDLLDHCIEVHDLGPEDALATSQDLSALAKWHDRDHTVLAHHSTHTHDASDEDNRTGSAAVVAALSRQEGE